jgi:RNA polymerase sigma factor (sigma-70 family)
MDDALVRRAQRGDERAFDQLVEVYSPLIWRTAVALLGNRALAEDAMQEAWLDVWRALATFHADGTFRAWLLVIVANRCYKMIRRRALPIYFLEHDGIGLTADLASGDDTEDIALRHVRDIAHSLTRSTLLASSSPSTRGLRCL